jgi:hypothetical protein
MDDTGQATPAHDLCVEDRHAEIAGLDALHQKEWVFRESSG